MRSTYFADSWFFIASLDRHDAHHRAAGRIAKSLLRGALIVTHDGVLTEVLAHLSADGARARQAAVDAVRGTLREHVVVTVTRALFLAGIDYYALRPDKEYSLTDCISMVLMRDRGITHVLTNDHHFRQEGFTVLSDAP